MAESAHLWAIAFNSVECAKEFRAEIAKLADEKSLVLLDIVHAIRYADGGSQFAQERQIEDAVDPAEEVIRRDERLQVNACLGLRLECMHSLHGGLPPGERQTSQTQRL